MYRVMKGCNWKDFSAKEGDTVTTERFESLPPDLQAHWLSNGAVVHDDCDEADDDTAFHAGGNE